MVKVAILQHWQKRPETTTIMVTLNATARCTPQVQHICHLKGLGVGIVSKQSTDTCPPVRSANNNPSPEPHPSMLPDQDRTTVATCTSHPSPEARTVTGPWKSQQGFGGGHSGFGALGSQGCWAYGTVSDGFLEGAVLLCCLCRLFSSRT